MSINQLEHGIITCLFCWQMREKAVECWESLVLPLGRRQLRQGRKQPSLKLGGEPLVQQSKELVMVSEMT